LARVVGMLDHEFSDQQCPDYAYWTDLAKFAAGQAEEGFAEENLTFDGFKTLGWAFVAVYGLAPGGAPAERFSMRVDPEASEGTPLEPVVRRFIEQELLAGLGRHAEPLHGLAEIGGKTYLVASLPTKTNEQRRAPAPGRFVAARRVDPAWVDRVARFTALSVRLEPARAAASDPTLRRAQEAFDQGATVYLETPTAQLLLGVIPLRDFRGQPLLLARVERPRATRALGSAVLRSTVLTLAAGGALLLVVSLALLGATVLAPIRHLLGSVKRLAAGELTEVTALGRDELGELGQEFNRMARALVDREAKLDRALAELWGEMDLAKRIQTALLPSHPSIPDFRVAAYMETAEEVGGDYYDVIPSPVGPWLAVGDVSGHGVSAGLVMMIARTAIRTAILHEAEAPGAPMRTTSPSRVLTTANRILVEDLRHLGADKYMTVSLLRRVDERLFAYAGLHLDIVVYRRDRGEVERIETRGMWLGVTPFIERHLRDQILEVRPGDVVVLYTDGVIEAELDEEPFGVDRLCAVVASAAERGDAERVRAALVEALEPYQRGDDVSFLVLERLAVAVPAEGEGPADRTGTSG
ncbi:MAG TPA: SpoIIE family protein phosphatase, partial [Polyangiaceae bacterium]|nr:SpoIIE family protein phosphatase [Polyangiaceae bacterium]